MASTVQEVVLDCADPARLARFWAALLGARWAALDEGWAMVDATPMLIAFQKVPEPKQSAKNRLHLDVRVRDAELAAARAERLGARRTGYAALDAHGEGHVVLQDPEGNEFCLVVDETGGWTSTVRRALDAAPVPRQAWHLTTLDAWRAGLANGLYRPAGFDGTVHAVRPGATVLLGQHADGLRGELRVLVLDLELVEADGVRVDGTDQLLVHAPLDPTWVADVQPAAFRTDGVLVVLD